MATVETLIPGDIVDNAGMSAVFIAQTQHPIYPSLRLVVWRIESGPLVGWSHDALSAQQYVGEVVRGNPESRLTNLRKALSGGAS